MGPSSLIAAFLALAPAALPGDALVVFAREPICYLGRTTADGTRVRIEYHPVEDSYHLLLSGSAIRPSSSGDWPLVTIRSGFDRDVYVASTVEGAAGAPSALYIGLTFPRQAPGVKRGTKIRNAPIERHLTNRQGIEIILGERTVASLSGENLPLAARELARCGNRFVGGRPSMATIRLNRLRVANGDSARRN